MIATASPKANLASTARKLSITIRPTRHRESMMPHAIRRAFRAAPPSIPAVVFVIVAVLVPIGLQQPLLNSDGDLARHLRHGRYMLEHGGLIRADPFSYTRPGAPFVGFEYGSQVLYSLAERLGGLPGVAILAGLLVGLTYALLARFLLKRGVDPLLAYLTTVMAALAGAGHWLARPHLFSFVAVMLLLELLERAPRKPFLPFAALFAIWANIHGGFVYGWILTGLYLAGSIGELLLGSDRAEWAARARYYTLALLTAVGATLLTPHGIALHRHLIEFLGKRFLFDNTAEFTSPDFHEVGAKLFLGTLLISIAALSVKGNRPSLPRLLVILAGAAMALIAVRNMALFGLTALSLLALHMDDAWRRVPDFRGVRGRFEATAGTAATLIWTVPAVLLLLALALGHGRVGSLQLIENRFDPTVFPVAAVRQARNEHLQGRLFSDFAWGGYVDYAWPEQKIFIDGGTDFFGEELFREYSKIIRMRPGWRQLLAKWDISLLLLPRESSLTHELARDGRWRTWYCDSLAVILHRSVAPATISPAQADSVDQAFEACGKGDSASVSILRSQKQLPPRLPTGSWRGPRLAHAPGVAFLHVAVRSHHQNEPRMDHVMARPPLVVRRRAATLGPNARSQS
jgi:hypothetical protein